MTYPSDIPIESGTRTAQDHLDWLLEMKASVRWLQAYLFRTQAGVDGVMPFEAESGWDPEDTMKCVAQDSPDMTVKIYVGLAFVNGQPVSKDELAISATMVAPVSNPRIDRVELEENGTYSINEGTEAGSPSAPTLSDESISIALIYHVVGETIIEDSEGSDGWIVDDRTLLGGF